jgi:hypothetical protein
MLTDVFRLSNLTVFFNKLGKFRVKKKIVKMKESEKLLLNLDQFAILKSKYLQGMRKSKAYIKGGHL